MGLAYTTYLGPYARCQFTKVQSSTTKRTCSKMTCADYEKEAHDNSLKFCSLCGSPVHDRAITAEMDSVDSCEVEELIGGALRMVDDGDLSEQAEDCILWLPNREVQSDRDWSFDPRDGAVLAEITASTIKEEMSLFSREFKKELGVLRKSYGKKNVTVVWGLVHWIH